MLRSKHFVGLILTAMLMATLIPFSGIVYAQTKEEAKDFIKLAERAKDKANELMEIMESEGLNITEATMERYEEGVGNLTAAEAELEKDDPNFSLAVELAEEAMEAFKEVYEELYTLLGDAGVTIASDDDESAEGLLIAMDRALVRIGKIRDILVNTTGTDVGNVTKVLDSAETYLNVTKAEEWLAAGMVNQTAWNLTQANKLIGLAHSLLKKGGQELKVKRMEHYLDILEKFCDRLERLGAEDLGEVKELITDAIEYLSVGNIQQAMENLIEARNQLEQIKRELLEQRRGKPPVPSWHVLANLTDDIPFNDVEAIITKTDKAKSVEFKVEIISENEPHGVYGMGIAVSTSNETIDFQVWYAEHGLHHDDNTTEIGWWYQEYDEGWGTREPVRLEESGTGITATGKGAPAPGEKVFTVDIPIKLLGKRGATYYFAIQFRTNLLGTYPEGLDLWAQTNATNFAEATVGTPSNEG